MNTASKSNSWQARLASLTDTRNVLSFAIGLLVIGAVVTGWYGYRWFSYSKEEQAQRALSQCYAQFETASKDKAPDWQAVEKACALTYQNYANSTAAPYLLALQSDIALQQDKKEDAITFMDKAVIALPSSSTVYYLYKTKRALMNIDSADEKRVESGLSELQQVAFDANNKNNDEALFYLGLYHWQKNDVEKAQQAWQPLTTMPVNVEGGSPWASLAQEKLKLL